MSEPIFVHQSGIKCPFGRSTTCILRG